MPTSGHLAQSTPESDALGRALMQFRAAINISREQFSDMLQKQIKREPAHQLTETEIALLTQKDKLALLIEKGTFWPSPGLIALCEAAFPRADHAKKVAEMKKAYGVMSLVTNVVAEEEKMISRIPRVASAAAYQAGRDALVAKATGGRFKNVDDITQKLAAANPTSNLNEAKDKVSSFFTHPNGTPATYYEINRLGGKLFPGVLPIRAYLDKAILRLPVLNEKIIEQHMKMFADVLNKLGKSAEEIEHFKTAFTDLCAAIIKDPRSKNSLMTQKMRANIGYITEPKDQPPSR